VLRGFSAAPRLTISHAAANQGDVWCMVGSGC
jgi:hypothetical protein